MCFGIRYRWIGLILTAVGLTGLCTAETVTELQTAYTGTTIWNAGTGTLTFTGTGEIAFSKSNYEGCIWIVPSQVKTIVIEENVRVTGSFDVRYNCTIEGRNRYTSELYGTPEQRWADNRGVSAITFSAVVTGNGTTVTVQNLTSLNPKGYHIRGSWNGRMYVYDCDFIDDRGGHGNHSDGFVGGDGSIVRNCYFETGDDIIKVYNDVTVEDTTINMIQNAVPIQMGWSSYGRNAVGIFRNLTILGNDGRGDNPIIDGADGVNNLYITIDGCDIQNPNAVLVRLKDPGQYLELTIEDAFIDIQQFASSQHVGTVVHSICGTTAQTNFYDCYNDDLLVHYALDGDVQDLSGQNHHGALTGGAFVQGMIDRDQGLELNGLSEYVQIPSFSGVGADTGRTVTAWVKTDAAASQAIVSWGTMETGKLWLLYIDPQGFLNAAVWGGGTKSTIPVADGRWHHIAAVLDNRQSDSRYIKIFIDGWPAFAALPDVCTINTVLADPVHVGTWHKTLDGQKTFYFNGVLDDVRIYNYPMTMPQIQEICAVSPPDPDIVPNGIIDLADLAQLAGFWIDDTCFSNELCAGTDLNADGLVNYADYRILSERWLSQLVSWNAQDIGAVSAAGSTVVSDDTITIEGSGADIWNNVDEFHYYYTTLSGDGEIVARVVSQENTNTWAKAGVMIRQSLDADSKHAMMVVTPGNGTSFQRRTATGGGSDHTTPQNGQSAPVWVKLVRSGNTLTGSSSTNGNNWTQIGSDTVSMAADVYVGLCVTSHEDGMLSTVVFDQIFVLHE